jgi:hypothetical protein
MLFETPKKDWINKKKFEMLFETPKNRVFMKMQNSQNLFSMKIFISTLF